MQVEQLLNNPIRTQIHTHSVLQYLCLQKGQQLVGETSQELLGQEGGDSWASWWRSASHVVKCSRIDGFNKKKNECHVWLVCAARKKMPFYYKRDLLLCSN